MYVLPLSVPVPSSKYLLLALSVLLLSPHYEYSC